MYNYMAMESYKASVRLQELCNRINMENAIATSHYAWPTGTWAAEQLKRTLGDVGSMTKEQQSVIIADLQLRGQEKGREIETLRQTLDNCNQDLLRHSRDLRACTEALREAKGEAIEHVKRMSLWEFWNWRRTA